MAVSGAFAESAYVPTKDYVDDGIKAVYRKAKEADAAIQTDLNALSVYVGAPSTSSAPATGLTKQIEDLTAEVTLTTYSGNGMGINVTADKKIEIANLNGTTAEDGKPYVFRNNSASLLEVADTWEIE